MGNYKKSLELIKSDCCRYYGQQDMSILKMMYYAIRNHCFGYSFWFRLASERGLLRWLSKVMLKRLSSKYGLQIPVGTKIGHGLYIGHGIGIVINSTAIIGNNCNLSQFTTIGSNHGKAATIGDNVYIGPSVCIVEDVHIGNNVSIGAGAVVVHDVPDNATVAGVPAKIISYKSPGRYINKRYHPL
ncbi:serine O-acetyltransferase [Parabacteroides sp.]